MSKLLSALVLSLMMVIFLAGCGGDGAEKAGDGAKTEAVDKAHADHPKADHPEGDHPKSDHPKSDEKKSDHPK